MKTDVLYTITLRNFVVPTRSVWWVNLFRETGVLHRITISFSDFLSYLLSFTQFTLDIKQRTAISSKTTGSFLAK
jgi:hypothetical protein